jgi:hypothetical protein
MILRLGDCNPVDVLQLPDGSTVCLTDQAPPATPAVTSLPPFCDPTWTAINGGVCTDALGNYRTATGASVSGDQILAALHTPVKAPVKGLPFNIDTQTLAFILGGVFFFVLVLPRGRR